MITSQLYISFNSCNLSPLKNNCFSYSVFCDDILLVDLFTLVINDLVSDTVVYLKADLFTNLLYGVIVIIDTPVSVIP